MYNNQVTNIHLKRVICILYAVTKTLQYLHLQLMIGTFLITNAYYCISGCISERLKYINFVISIFTICKYISTYVIRFVWPDMGQLCF